jgi:hypothetical protein
VAAGEISCYRPAYCRNTCRRLAALREELCSVRIDPTVIPETRVIYRRLVGVGGPPEFRLAGGWFSSVVGSEEGGDELSSAGDAELVEHSGGVLAPCVR